jgi:hypothetical protein
MNPLNEANSIEINRIIRMKALAWNLLSFFIGYVPNLLIKHAFNSATVPIAKVH